MVININKRKFYLLVLYTVFAVLLNQLIISGTITDIHSWLIRGTIIGLVMLTVQLLILRALKGSLISLEAVFLIAMYIFYGAQNFLLTIGYNFKSLSYQIAYIRFGTEKYIASNKYALLCILYGFASIVLANITEEMNAYYAEKNIDVDKLSNYLLIISFPIECYNFLAKIIAMRIGGYDASHDAATGDFIDLFSGIFFAGLILKILACEENKVKTKKILFISIFYYILYMFTGLRALALIKIIIIFWVYVKCVGHVDIKSIIRILLFGIVLSFILVYIRSARDSIAFSVNGNIFLDALSEFGITARVITANFDQVKEFSHGMSLVCSFLSTIPGWTYLFGSELMNRYYPFYALNQGAWGSSLVSDFYFDFGFIGGIVASSIYTFIFSKICGQFEKCINQKNYYYLAVFSFFALQMIWTIRSYIFRLPRYFIWFLILYWTLTSLVKKRQTV